jgi:hypothetical protein
LYLKELQIIPLRIIRNGKCTASGGVVEGSLTNAGHACVVAHLTAAEAGRMPFHQTDYSSMASLEAARRIAFVLF